MIPSEKPYAPIHMKITLEYTTLIITFDSGIASSDIDAIMLSSGCIEKMLELQPHFGKPKFTIERYVICPNCKQESSLEVVDALGVPQCPKCGASLKEAIEI